MDLYDLQDEIKQLERKRELLTESLRRIRKHLILISMGDSRRDALEFDQEEKEAELNAVKEEIASYQGLMLYKSLMNLDYIDHTSLFMSVSRTYRVGAFILHGSAYPYHDYQGYSVRTLLKRLVYTVPNSVATPLMHLDLSSRVRSSDVAALWRYLAAEVNLGTDARCEDIIKRVCTKLQKQNVILILHGVDYIPEEHLHKIIHEFWEPLAIVAHQAQHPTNRYLLLMFLVDYRGGVRDWKISCAERPDESWEPHIPIRLPTVTRFSDHDLSKWIDHWSETLYDILPDNLRQGPLEIRVQSILEKSDDGIPDLVMSHICNQCGFYLEGAEKCLRL